uniref:EF-hand domain-containing protein n=1 Tax=Chromera velia CCMP2878 TaxID=1169474 RepID=A0A0G4HDI8_9ALVE|eukprot:Cvel_6395.t1-p1 / transcript=Cvel_6395.t1 / gene=Cvel_6395 / organism=Chromera_velia_CCMP2878 / gene_product=Calmodulin, putative / transcript_product=Calmodulin, putative / location=Cvel_scaffold312:47952-50368(+) / protein_length=150 / sequence_SO=supercontig / SO=protein_coding / is_pseudo=false
MSGAAGGGDGGISNVPQNDLREFREIFNLVDSDGSGMISTEELGKLLATLGIPTSEETLKMMVSEVDDNGNGEIDFEGPWVEFVRVMSRRVNADYTAEEVDRAFRLFANNVPEGMIKLADLEKALTSYGKNRMTKEEVGQTDRQTDRGRR